MSEANPQENFAPMKFSVPSLLSPPEPKQIDTFAAMDSSASRTPMSTDNADISIQSKRHAHFAEKMNKNRLPLSPPVSPHATSHREHNSYLSRDYSEKDPQLFRFSDDGSSLPVDVPLFPTAPTKTTVEELINERIAEREMQEKSTALPTKEEYFLAVSCVAKGYNRNPAAWLRREREWLNSHYGNSSRIKKPFASASRRVAPAPIAGLKRTKPASVIARIPRVKRTPKAKVYDSFDPYEPLSPKAPRQPTNRDDVDYHSLPDFSPPLSTLPKGNNKALKADWKGQMLDLSADPDRHLLHEAEVNLAATLRLSCATYLCSKRRIFQARIEALRIGKEFRKTDAQQACKIDVNKASKLWSAYDRVGWLKKELFQQHV